MFPLTIILYQRNNIEREIERGETSEESFEEKLRDFWGREGTEARRHPRGFSERDVGLVNGGVGASSALFEFLSV